MLAVRVKKAAGWPSSGSVTRTGGLSCVWLKKHCRRMAIRRLLERELVSRRASHPLGFPRRTHPRYNYLMEAAARQQKIEQALQYQRAGRLVEAEAICRELHTQAPGHAGVTHWLGLLNYQLNRNE